MDIVYTLKVTFIGAVILAFIGLCVAQFIDNIYPS